jgi:hypothetical protein
MGCRALQPLFAFRTLLLILCWNASASLASSVEPSHNTLEAGSGSLSLSSSLATAGVPLTFFVKSADADAVVCVQVLDSSLQVLKSFVGSREFNGSFSVDTASRHSVVRYALRSGGLKFSSSSFPFGRFDEGLTVSTIKSTELPTIKNIELSRDESLRPYVQWVGMLKGPCTGDFYLNVTSSHAYALRVNASVLIDNLDLRVVGLSTTIVSLYIVENSFSDIEVSSHVIPPDANSIFYYVPAP